MIFNTLAKKLIVILATIMLFACCVTGYITYQLHVNISEKEVAEQFAQRVEQVAARVDLRLQDVYRLSDQIVLNPVIVEALSQSNEGEQLNHTEKVDLIRQLNPMNLSLPNLMTFYIYDLQGNYYTPGNTFLVNDLGKIVRDQVNEALQNSDGELVWIKGKIAEGEAGPFSSKTGMILASRWLKDTQMNVYGVLVMVLNQSILANDLNMVIKGDDSRVYLFDRYSLLYSDEENIDEVDMEFLQSVEHAGIRNVEGTPYLFAQSQTETTNFKLVSRISLQTLKEKSQLLIKATFVSAAISAMLGAILAILASKRLLRPLKKLVQGMRKVRSGNLKTRIEVKTKDELSYIGESFNSMVENIDSLIKEVYLKQLREREAELTALQAQLNPHFLYNTLDMIHSRLYLQDDKVTAGLVVSLSNLLRYALEPASSETTIDEEFKQITNYLRLQKARFEQNLEITIDVSEEVKQCGIIRLLLQPLVENTFVHAFRDHTDVMKVSLHAYREDQMLVIEIHDNGCGISEEAMHLFTPAQMKLGTNPKRLGIDNVIRRIALYYGSPPYGIEFKRGETEGTNVRLHLPYRILKTEHEEGKVDVWDGSRRR